MSSDTNDKILVTGCINNDRKSQEILYRTYFKNMFDMCRYYTQNDDRAKEVLNIGFLRVFQKIHLFRFEGSLESWIRKLIYHVCMRELAKKDELHSLDSITDSEQQSHDYTLEKMFHTEILELIETLPPASANAFMLFANGYSHLEISKKMNISVGTSKWHISAARKQLQTLIENYYEKSFKI
ncbi:MAG: sigma-70 family RNA polymerase sigma factor [Saprospiraceae bacterium]|nr:sigma-70 family RNA polymerase sigma factor [Saprospiraceae bacterium]MCC6844538.1 sigma-70 family RNA polymerase sigma factor [Saprospiraceae bacterium]